MRKRDIARWALEASLVLGIGAFSAKAVYEFGNPAQRNWVYDDDYHRYKIVEMRYESPISRLGVIAGGLTGVGLPGVPLLLWETTRRKGEERTR